MVCILWSLQVPNDYTVIGDPHITHKSLDKAPILFDQVESLGKTAIWLGDLLDTKEIIRGKCQNTFFNYFKDSKLTHIIIVGNHDYFNLECKDHSLRTLSGLPNVIIVDELQQIDNMWFVPYIHDPVRLREILNHITESEVSPVLFCHVDTVGFDYGNGHLSEAGLAIEDFSNFKRVISGHYHKFQESKNFMYLGSPFSHSFGESNQSKHLGTYNFDTNELELIPTSFPRHVSLEVDTQVSNGLDAKMFLEHNKDNVSRLVLKGTSESIAKYDLTRFEEFEFKVAAKTIDSGEDVVVLDEGADNKTQFMQWATDIKKLSPDTVALGVSILEALSAK